MSKQLLHLNQTVTSDMVTRKVMDGAESIVIRSATLPDNVVMNGGLYPAEEIANSFASLERVLAPMGHPQKGGKFISATDPYAIHNFDVGAYVANVERRDGKVYHDTVINISVAETTPKGRELLEAVANMEATGEPIHTSTGVLLEREPLDAPQTNSAGIEYSWIARNMMFDHNAILINQPGAATPEQGVGMMVNMEMVDMETYPMEDVSLIERVETLKDALKDHVAMREAGARWIYIADIYPETQKFIYEIEFENGADEYRERSYSIADDGEVMIGETFTKVKRKYKWVINRRLESFMQNMKFAPSNHADYNGSVTTNHSDEELDMPMTPEERAALVADIAKEVQANMAETIKNAATSAVEPIANELKKLTANAEAEAKAEREALEADALAAGFSDEEVKGMATNSLKAVVSKRKPDLKAKRAAGGIDTNAEKDQWEGYDLNANLEAK